MLRGFYSLDEISETYLKINARKEMIELVLDLGEFLNKVFI